LANELDIPLNKAKRFYYSNRNGLTYKYTLSDNYIDLLISIYDKSKQYKRSFPRSYKEPINDAIIESISIGIMKALNESF